MCKCSLLSSIVVVVHSDHLYVMRARAAEVVQYLRSLQDLAHLPAPPVRHMWVHECEEVVNVSRQDAEQVGLDGVPDEEGEEEQCPGEVGSIELEETEQRHPHIGVLGRASPDISHGEGERMAEELYPRERAEGEGK